jgi:hypothetical protein
MKLKMSLFLVVFSLSVIYYLFANPYYRVLRAENEDGHGSFYLELYWSVFSRSTCVDLLKKLVNDNNDFETMTLVSSFCNEKQICELVETLNKDIKKVSSWPVDTSWSDTIYYGYRRSCSRTTFLNSGVLQDSKKLTLDCAAK